MKGKKLVSLLAVFVSLLAWLPSFAHHGTSSYDLQHEVTLEGVVKDFQWSSPHSWLYVTVTNGKGEIEEWGGETGAPCTLARRGWTSHLFKAGDRVKISGHSAKDGTKVIMLTKIQTADGRVF
jgi:DNA/RNA endonuclease YhcR with UshA esterase domain